MLQHDPFDGTQLACREADIVVERHWNEPELRRRTAGVNMNVTRLAEIAGYGRVCRVVQKMSLVFLPS